MHLSNYSPFVAFQCKRPEEPENGVMDCSDNKEILPYKSSCNFKCKEGFTLVGSPSMKCMSPYQWTEEPPKCEGKYSTYQSSVN